MGKSESLHEALNSCVNGVCNDSCCTCAAAFNKSHHICIFILFCVFVVICFCHNYCTLCVISSFILWSWFLLRRRRLNQKLFIEESTEPFSSSEGSVASGKTCLLCPTQVQRELLFLNLNMAKCCRMLLCAQAFLSVCLYEAF